MFYAPSSVVVLPKESEESDNASKEKLMALLNPRFLADVPYILRLQYCHLNRGP